MAVRWKFWRREDRARRGEVRRTLRRRVKWGVRAILAALQNRLTRNWAATDNAVTDLIKQNLSIVRARARAAQWNRPIFARYLQLLKDNVVGPYGFTFQAQSKDIVNGQLMLDKLANDTIEAGWREWGRAENCDASGRQSLAAMQRSMMESWGTDGEIIVHYVKGPQFGKFGFAIETVDPALLDESYCEDFADGRKIRHAIELDRWGKPLAYCFDDDKAKGGKSRYPADEILHAFVVKRNGQFRGMPDSASVLFRLHTIEETEDGGITKVLAAANTLGIVTSGAPGEGPVDSEDSQGDMVTLESGTILRLQEGELFNGFDPKFPDAAFAPFLKHMLQGVASGLGISYPNLSGNLEGVSYSSIRQGELTEREMWKGIQHWFIEAVLEPIYREWLRVQLLRGSLLIPSKSGDPRPLPIAKESKFQDARFGGRRWSWVDPMSEVQAQEKALAMGETTVSQGIRESGRDPQEVWDEREREIAEMKRRGIPVTYGGITLGGVSGAGGSDASAQQAGG